MSRLFELKRFVWVMFCVVLLTRVTSEAVGDEPADQAFAPPSTASIEPAAAGPEEKRSLGAEMFSKIRAAGWIGYILLGLSVVGVACTIERLVNLRRSHVVPAGLAERVLSQLLEGRYDAAVNSCGQSPSTLGRTLNAVARHHDFPFNDLAVITGDIGVREIRQHLQRAYPLAIIATLGPLLGLLGTVIGMIDSFEAVALAGSMGDPSVMASSISFALITTAIGLLIAAPNLALYHIFRVRTNNLAALLDEQVSEVLLEWQARRRKGQTLDGSAATLANDSIDRHPQPAESVDGRTTKVSVSEGGCDA